ncbi:MAG TPA: L,D-transpeptidase family protein [Ferruginibacter sp.]|nr:L,D-transpeptidase family protein [Ferruginibacter sp.]HMP21377.1 L,D-transpeptidase family protein [Ferruginibacter sp.]
MPQSFLNTTRLLSVVAILSLLQFLVSCNESGNQKQASVDTLSRIDMHKDASIPGSFSTQTTLKFDSAVLKIFMDSFPAFKEFEKDIYSFYQGRDYAYAWFDENGLTEPAHNLYNRIEHIADEGLNVDLPYTDKFEMIMDEYDGAGPASPNLELMLTSQYLEYAKNVWQGLSEKQANTIQWLLPRKKISNSQLLDSLANKGALQNEPVYKQYHLLKASLRRLNDIKKAGTLPVIQMNEKKLQLGDSSPTVLQVRKWLQLMGDIATDTQSPFFDSSIFAGVKRFQQRMGLKPDGVFGVQAKEEMNVPLEVRAEQIMVNMERCRWVPVQLQQDYLLVNIPDFKLHIFENDTLVFSMNVVVGKAQHKTVIFSGDLKYVVFSPYWNIPPGILKNEVLPAIKRNPRYLAQHNMEWNGGNVRQKPGPNNSLGLVKFLFPNSHNIYLHDSPAKSLFNETTRAFSHGCIRVAEPKKLALYLLRNEPGWDEAKVTAAMNRGQEQTVVLKKNIPVYITYFTSWVDSNGLLNFRKDIYKRDTRLSKNILEKPAI